MGGADGRGCSGATDALVLGAWRWLGPPFAFGEVDAGTLGAWSGSEADFGRGGGVVLRGPCAWGMVVFTGFKGGRGGCKEGRG